MITALRAELKKIRGRFLWALPLVVVGMEFLWMMSNSYLAKPEASAEGYFNLLFQLPLLNTIFLPLILAVMASRICDAENKGNTYKLLCTMQEKKRYSTQSSFWEVSISFSSPCWKAPMFCCLEGCCTSRSRFP